VETSLKQRLRDNYLKILEYWTGNAFRARSYPLLCMFRLEPCKESAEVRVVRFALISRLGTAAPRHELKAITHT